MLTLVFAAVAVAFGVAWWRRVAAYRRVSGAFRPAAGQLAHLQPALQRVVPHQVVEGIIQRGVHTSGERRVVTVLIADLVGFTALSERSEPEVVVRLLNGYLQAMASAIAEHGGYVSKFMGDGILALFGTPERNPWQALDAVEAALAMRAALARYNAELAAAGHPPLRIGVGVHCGPAVVGLLGNAELVEYTAIGDVVNTAARIEGMTRQFGVDILVSAELRAELHDRHPLREMPPVEVKGKAGALVTFAVDPR